MMGNPRFEFAWDVVGHGYQWVEGLPLLRPGAPVGLYLVERLPGRAGRRVRRYEPLLELTGLFRTFAETETTPEGILDFANAHGPLGVATAIESTADVTPGEPARRFEGEPLFKWQCEIIRLHGVVRLWDLLSSHDETGLKSHIVWDGSHRVRFDDQSALRDDRHWLETLVIASGDERNPDLFKELVPGDVVQPAWAYVLEYVNAYLHEHTSPAVGWSDGRVRLSNRPRSLLGALWVQVAEAIDDEKRFRRCSECDRWFEMSKSVARSDKRYCGNACRVKAYQMRKMRAREMHAKGIAIGTIAERLDSKAAVIQRWVESGVAKISK